MGFRPDMERILRLLLSSKTTRQTLLFLATIPDQVNEIANMALRPNRNFVDTVSDDSEQTHMHVQQQLMITSQDKIIHDLFCILHHETNNSAGSGGGGVGVYKIIVFFTTARLTGFMSELFNSVAGETGYTVLRCIHVRPSRRANRSSSANRAMR